MVAVILILFDRGRRRSRSSGSHDRVFGLVRCCIVVIVGVVVFVVLELLESLVVVVVLAVVVVLVVVVVLAVVVVLVVVVILDVVEVLVIVVVLIVVVVVIVGRGGVGSGGGRVLPGARRVRKIFPGRYRRIQPRLLRLLDHASGLRSFQPPVDIQTLDVQIDDQIVKRVEVEAVGESRSPMAAFPRRARSPTPPTAVPLSRRRFFAVAGGRRCGAGSAEL